MKAPRDIAVLGIALFSLAISLVAIWKMDGGRDAFVPETTAGEGTSGEIARIGESLDSLGDRIAAMEMSRGTAGRGERADDGNAEAPSTGDRLKALEASMAKLQSAFDGITVEGTAEERAALFAAEDGFEKADAYFEAGKFTIAADGYLQFVQAHPDHPDARNILQRAREAYQKAGYSDMAIWVQGEMMKSFPESREKDLMTLASMEKTAGRYDEAVKHSAEAVDLATNEQTAIWNRLYWAWYNQLRDGDEAGLDAYRQVQADIQRAGLGDSKMARRAQEKIDELQKQIAGQR